MSGLPEWAEWNGGEPATSYTLGAEEEVMLLNPTTGRWRSRSGGSSGRCLTTCPTT